MPASCGTGRPMARRRQRSVPAQPRGYGLIGALELIPREGKAALTPTSMLGNKADNLIRTEGVIVRGIRDLIASPPLIITTPKWTNSLMR